MKLIEETDEINEYSSSKKEHSNEEIIEYAKYLGMKLPEDNDLLWIAEKGLDAPVIDPWVA
jgi:cell division protein FtsL